MTIAIPDNRVLTLAAKDGGGFQSEGLEAAIDPPAAFTPLLTRDFAGTTVGQATAVPDGWSKGDYVDTPTKSGNRALRLRRAVTETGSCPYGSGAQEYGGRFNLPEEVPVGNIIWMRFYVYFPAGFSFGYLYSGSDSSVLDACGIGGGADGANNTKFMVLAPSGGTARTYIMLSASRREIIPSSPFLRIDTEAASGENLDFPYTFQFDQYCAFQVAVKVASDNTGWIRLWVDAEFIGETTGHPTVAGAGNTIAEWGIGDYWNGYPWTDGVGDRGPFYLDEVVIATDMPGYGAPTGLDSGGRVYIDPTTLVGDL